MRPRFTVLFHAITTATLAAGCGGHTIDKSRFNQNACPPAGQSEIRGFRVAPPADYIALHDSMRAGGIVDSVGVPCKTATDPPKCKAAFDLASASSGDFGKGWFVGNVGSRQYLVVTRGDEVLTVDTLDGLKKFLAPIHTASEASMLVGIGFRDHLVVCDGQNNAREVADGFEVLTKAGSGCGKDDVELHVVHVGRDGAVAVVERETLEKANPNCVVGRRPEGFAPCALRRDDGAAETFAEMAVLEAASIAAFRRLEAELRAHGAPARSIRAARRAAHDEVRHTRMMLRLARRFGASPRMPRIAPLPVRALEAIALENAVEGCVRETFGALLATFQARAAADREIAGTMRRIARDETRHAELAWDVARFFEPRLSPTARARVDTARREAIEQLAASLHRAPSVEVATLAGAPTPDQATALFQSMRGSLWAA